MAERVKKAQDAKTDKLNSEFYKKPDDVKKFSIMRPEDKEKHIVKETYANGVVKQKLEKITKRGKLIYQGMRSKA